MDGISLSTFHPIEHLSPTELESAALSPFRFVNRVDASITAGKNIRPLTTRVLAPNVSPLTPTEGMDIPFDCHSIFLVPGGRFMLADTTDHGLCLWDLGIQPGLPINRSPLAVLHKASGELTRFTSPTPDAHGVYICIAGEMNLNTEHTCLSVHELYPSFPNVTFRPTHSLKVKGEVDCIYIYRNVLACNHGNNQVTVWNFMQNKGVSWEYTKEITDVFIFADSLTLVEDEHFTVWDINDSFYLPNDEINGVPLIQHLPRLIRGHSDLGQNGISLLSPPSQWVSPGCRPPFFGLCTQFQEEAPTMQSYTFESIDPPHNLQLQRFDPLLTDLVDSLPLSLVDTEEFLRHLRFCDQYLVIAWLDDSYIAISFLHTPVAGPFKYVRPKTRYLGFNSESHFEDIVVNDFDFCPASGRLVVTTDSGDIRIMDYLDPPISMIISKV